MAIQQRKKSRKIYVKVTSDFDSTGYMQPRSIIWSDGRAFPIEQVRDFRPASSQEDGRDRYTVIIRGQEKYLFFERADPRFAGRFGRWFVEASQTV